MIIIANVVGTTDLSLFRKTPLNNSSSEIGDIITVDIIPVFEMDFMVIPERECGSNDSMLGMKF